MFIKSRVFKDEDTLMEMLFDFSLGNAAPLVQQLKKKIDKELANNKTYQEYLASLTDEEDKLELETEERLIRLAEALMERFDSFQTKQQKLFGIKNDEHVLLCEIDFV